MEQKMKRILVRLASQVSTHSNQFVATAKRYAACHV